MQTIEIIQDLEEDEIERWIQEDTQPNQDALIWLIWFIYVLMLFCFWPGQVTF